MLPWYCAQYLFLSKIPVTTRGFELQIPCIQSSYLNQYAVMLLSFMAQWVRKLLPMKEICSSNPPAVTGICDSNKSIQQHHHRLKLASKFKYLQIIHVFSVIFYSEKRQLKTSNKKRRLMTWSQKSHRLMYRF